MCFSKKLFFKIEKNEKNTYQILFDIFSMFSFVSLSIKDLHIFIIFAIMFILFGLFFLFFPCFFEILLNFVVILSVLLLGIILLGWFVFNIWNSDSYYCIYFTNWAFFSKRQYKMRFCGKQILRSIF